MSSDLNCVSWNVNGIRAVARKDIDPLSVVAGANVVTLQETKAREDQAPKSLTKAAGWHGFWHSAQKPGYSGVAMFSRDQPDEVVLGMGDDTYDCEGRVISARFGDIVVIGAYFPNSQEGGKRLAYKLGFCAAMEKFLNDWQQAGRHTVLMGDYNIAHQPIDLARPKDNEANPGYLPEERAWMTHYLGLGYRDIFRETNPDTAGAYSWWSYRGGARQRNVGWRIDYATVSDGLAGRVKDCTIHPDVLGSDHCPVSVVL